MLRRAALVVAGLLLLAAPLSAQDARQRPKPVEVSRAAQDAFGSAAPRIKEAQDAFAAKQWDAATAKYAEAMTALGADEALGGWRDQVLYNTACAHARAGRPAEAAETFAKSVKNGLRPLVEPTPGGSWYEAPGLNLEHVLVDADLDSVRKDKAYVDALAPYLAAGAPTIEFTRPDTNSLVPALIVLAAEGDDVERALPAWRVAAEKRRVALVALAGPVRPTPKDRRWTLRDGDERWAVAKIRETLDVVAKDVRIDGKRVFVVGMGERPGEAAWAAALAEPSRVAGLAAPGARFHAAWHADAIAAAPKTWRVALGAGDEEPAKMLKERGIEAACVEASNDESKSAAAIFDALLGKP